jgi:hypothetical protein
MVTSHRHCGRWYGSSTRTAAQQRRGSRRTAATARPVARFHAQGDARSKWQGDGAAARLDSGGRRWLDVAEETGRLRTQRGSALGRSSAAAVPQDGVGVPARGRRATHASELAMTTNTGTLVLRTIFKAWTATKITAEITKPSSL